LDCDPPVLALGEDLIAGRFGELRVVEVRSAPAVKSVRIKRSPVGWDCRLQETPNAPSNHLLSLVPLQDAIGEFRETVELEAVAVDGRVVATQPITAEGRVVEPVELLPRVVELGETRAGSRYRARLTVAARDGGTVEIEGMKSDDPTVRFTSSRLHGLLQVELEGEALTLGSGESSGTIRVGHNRSALHSLTYRVRWYGVGDEGER